MNVLLATDWNRFVATKRFFVLRTVAVAAPLVFFMLGLGRLAAAPADELGRSIFGITTTFLLLGILVGAPALAGPALAVERKAGRIDVLLSTPVSLRSLVYARFLGRAGLLALLLVTGVPWLAVSLLFGGVSSGEAWRAVAVLGASLVAATGVSLLAGAGTDDTTAAIRRAVFLTLGPVAAASLLGTMFAGGNNDFVAGILGAIARNADPFAALAAAGGADAGTSRRIATFCVLAALAGVLGVVLACAGLDRRRDGAGAGRRSGAAEVRAAGSVFAFWSRRARGRIRLRGAYSRFQTLLRQAPLAWLEVVRGTRRPARGRLAALILFGIAAEALFVAGLADGPAAAVGVPGRRAAAPGLGLHLSATAAFLALAFVTVTGAGAAAFHRDQDARLLEVIHSTPRPTREIVAGKLGGCLAAALPWWLLSLAHAVLGLVSGAFAYEGVSCYVFTSAALLLCAGAVALTEGLLAPSGTRAAVRAFLRLALGIILPSLLLSPMTLITMARSPGSFAEVFVAVLWMPMLPLLFEPGSKHLLAMFVASGILVAIAVRLVGLTLARRLPELYAWRREGQTGPPPEARRGVDEDIRKWRVHVRGTSTYPRIRRSRP